MEGVASLAIRYQSYYDQYKQLALEIEASLKQPTEGRNKLLHELTEAFGIVLANFETKLNLISEESFKPKKKGFFEGLFGGDPPQKIEKPKSSLEGDFRYVIEEQKWHFVSEEEEGFFLDLQTKRKAWIQKAEELKAKDVMKKELLDFALNHNLLNGALYENTFRRLNCNFR